jgi:putative redox protein
VKKAKKYMKITTHMLADELYESENENGNKVLIDMRKQEERRSQSPTELLLAALAGCGAVDIVLMLKKRKKKVLGLVIETEGTRREQTPRFFTKIHCHYNVTSPDVTKDELFKVAQLALDKYCSVASSLKSKITFSVEVRN